MGLLEEAACSDELSVKDSVCPPIPRLPQPTEEGSKVPSAVARQGTGEILPDHPLGPVAVSHGKIDEGQVTARVVQSLSESGDGEGLAGCSSDEKIDSCIRPTPKGFEIPEIGDEIGGWVGKARNRLGGGRARL